MRLPENEQELLWCGEWIKQLVLAAGWMPETAYLVALEWMKGLRKLMENRKDQEI